MSELSISTGHGIYLSANFEIEEKITQEQGWDSEARTYIISIGCGGADRDKSLRYEIRATGYSPPAYVLKPQHVYFLRGGFFPSNTHNTTKDLFYFEATDRAPVASTDVLKEDLENSVGITGCGIVLSIDTIVEDCMQYLKKSTDQDDKLTTVVTLQHGDYHPVEKQPAFSRLEYRIRPLRHLAGTPKILKLGREVNVHGYLKDFNEETGCYIAIVNKISLTSGHQASAAQKKADNASKQATATGASSKALKYVIPSSDDESLEQVVEKKSRVGEKASSSKNKPPKFNSSETVAGSGQSSLQSTSHGLRSSFKSPLIGSGSGSTDQLRFPPSDTDPSSFLPASTQSTAEKKKRGRPTGKKNSAKKSDIDLTKD